MTIETGIYTISSSGSYLGADYGQLQCWGSSVTDDNKWYIIDSGDGTYQIMWNKEREKGISYTGGEIMGEPAQFGYGSSNWKLPDAGSSGKITKSGSDMCLRSYEGQS